ncbi:MAG TPA: FtsX-like permease family protein [Rhodanobacteraceae bacterium]|nr:FtsX-like permease family protein [Rhodanobacteraceae bacterium]
MEIRPILSSLRHHKITALLVVLEIALTCAIVCNAVFLIANRMDRIHLVSGIAEHELVVVQVAGIGKDADGAARTVEDLARLRAIPGVKSVTVTNELPFSNSSWNSGLKLERDQKNNTLDATTYFAGPDFVRTLGLDIVAGRDFKPDEYADFKTVADPHFKGEAHVGLITRSLAQRLWPGESAIGKQFYIGDDPTTVIGVLANLARPNDQGGKGAREYTVVDPFNYPYNMGGRYVLRTTRSNRDRVLKAAVAALKVNGPGRIVIKQNTHTYDDIRADYFRSDRSMTWLLVGVIVALLLVTGLGIVGLGSFWVAQRRRTIGVRRALGATRGNILTYFQTENFLLVTIGIVLGMVLAYGINLFLMQRYELPRLPWAYLPAGAIALWLIGQLAVLGPALRASHVPPVVATRSV